MSLILEALKKLDREKQVPDRGLVVVGPSAWPSARDGRPGVGAVAVIALVLSGIGAAAWHYGGRPSAVVPREMAPREVAPRAPREGAPEPAAPGPFADARAVVPAPAPPSSARRANTPVTAPGPAEGAAPAPKATRGSVPEDAAASPRGAVPARGSSIEPRPVAGYQLQAISAQDGHPVAILNDHLVREGDSFDGAKVLRIGADEVEIEVAGRRRILKF